MGPAAVLACCVVVVGSLGGEMVRRGVRHHGQEVRACYERLLQRNPDAAGRVVVRFVVAPSGKVVESAVASSTLCHPPTEQCIADAVARWQFPAVRGGGSVVVTYPFVLRPAEEPPRRPSFTVEADE